LGRTGKGNQGSNSQSSIKSKATDELRDNEGQGGHRVERASQAQGLKTDKSIIH